MAVTALVAYMVTLVAALVWDAQRRADARVGKIDPEQFNDLLEEAETLREEVEAARMLREEVNSLNARMEIAWRKFGDLDVSVPDLKATVTSNANALAALRTAINAQSHAGRK